MCSREVMYCVVILNHLAPLPTFSPPYDSENVQHLTLLVLLEGQRVTVLPYRFSEPLLAVQSSPQRALSVSTCSYLDASLSAICPAYASVDHECCSPVTLAIEIRCLLGPLRSRSNVLINLKVIFGPSLVPSPFPTLQILLLSKLGASSPTLDLPILAY